jgi:AraC-like DNA-binding protein
LAIFNIALLLNVMPVWRRAAILTDIDEDEEAESFEDDELAEERSNRIAAEIELFVNTEAAYLDSHLKLEQVVERCNFSRRYVSKVFTERFGGFSDYVNGLRLNYFERYKLQTLALQTKVLQRPVVLPHTKRILKQKNDYHKSKI